MYTVKELIEALQQCPEDYQVNIYAPNGRVTIESLGIDIDNKSVDLFFSE